MADSAPIGDSVHAVLNSLPCSVTLPAGCGKTELIAAIAAETATRSGTSLVLTHTHAGVDALRRRMAKFGVPRDRVVVRTIDSWAYDLICHFPLLAGLQPPTAPNWNEVANYHRGAAKAVQSCAVAKMLRVTYDVVLVDEYQDCLIDQHALVVAVASTIPTAVFGDPLQGLFHFGKNKPVDWGTDVLSTFPNRCISYLPRRWGPDQRELATWLVDIRDDLIASRPINFSTAPIVWVERTNVGRFVSVCLDALELTGSVAVLGQFRPDCVNAASKLRGSYAVMEAIDEKVPSQLLETIDKQGGLKIAAALMEFAIGATAGLAAHVSKDKRTRLGQGKSFVTTKPELQDAYRAVRNVREDPCPNNLLVALTALIDLPGVTLHCREAWYEVVQSLQLIQYDPTLTAAEALVRMRNRTRVVGRRPRDHVVSRPLLVKGLEYDHVILLEPSRYSAQELYVALTRGSKSVTVLNESGVLSTRKMAGKKNAL